MREILFHSPRRLACLIGISIVTSGLGACAVGPDYRSPAVRAPDGFVDAPVGARPYGVRDDWWLTFDDPVLTRLIERAAKENLDVAQAVARVRQARAEANVSASAFYPTVDASGSATRSRTSENGQIPLGRIPGAEITNTVYRAGFDASWEIDLFGHVRRSVEAANARVGAAVASADQALLTIAGDVASEYVGVRWSRQQLALVDDDVRIAAETLRLTRLRRDVGDAADLDVERAETAMRNAEAQRPSAQADLRASQHRLEVLLAAEPGQLDPELAGDLPVPATAADLPVDLPASVLRRRPDVAGAERDLAAATADLGVAVAEQFPRFALVGSLGQEATARHSFTAAASRAWSIGPQVTIPIFQGGQLASQVRAREAGRDIALAVYRKSVLQALSDAETALIRDQREGQRHASLQRARTSAEAALAHEQQRYTAGDVALTDVLQTQRSRNDARQAELESTAAMARNRVALFKAFGGGWSALGQLAAVHPQRSFRIADQ